MTEQHKSALKELFPPWAARLQPYPAGKPIEEVERELGHSARKLASNENPLGPSPRALDAVRRSLHNVHLYPDSNGYELRTKLAETLQFHMDRVILGAGSTELIYLIARTLLSAEDEGVTSESAFHVYRLAIESAGAACKVVPTRDMTVDLVAIRHAMTPRTKVIFLANPNNPTGTMFAVTEFEQFLRAIPPQILVVLDQAYCDYVQRSDYSPSFNEMQKWENLLILRTFSKVYGLAGLRTGYGIGHPELIALLNRFRPPFNVSRLSQTAAIAALEDRDHVARSVESNSREMRFVSEELTLLGVRFTPSVANFVLVDTSRDCEHDFLKLLEEGVIVRPMKFYGFPTSLRVTIGTREDNEIFLESLRRVMVHATPSYPFRPTVAS
ncbi:MAG TPA: histidinol-phosphate transaminase [Terriglobia bacterium]|nr:histidinol-phosphate transaminase [Terriglobia bacterium]